MIAMGRPTHVLSSPDSPGRARHSVCGLLWISDENRDMFVEPHQASCKLCRRGRVVRIALKMRVAT